MALKENCHSCATLEVHASEDQAFQKSIKAEKNTTFSITTNLCGVLIGNKHFIETFNWLSGIT